MLTKSRSACLLLAGFFLLPLARPVEAFRGYFRTHDGDRHAYRYEQRRYYPYYGSYYWRPADKVRRRPGIKAPPYYQAWGLKRRHWRHRRNHLIGRRKLRW
ncbi:MAG: hypothetical protein ACR2PG_08775 [Hyphomicrobiaceae bacterium]